MSSFVFSNIKHIDVTLHVILFQFPLLKKHFLQMPVMTAAQLHSYCCLYGKKKACWKETTYLEGFTQDMSFLSVFLNVNCHANKPGAVF